jgi:hypothetical protein
MPKQETKPSKESALKTSLRRRIRNLYRRYNEQDWDSCYQILDPRLREENRIDPAVYAESLAAFSSTYGNVDIWHIRLSLHARPGENKNDGRPFAYAYVFWQDDRKALHVFRERWVLDGGRWYTRVVGLVGQEQRSPS